MPDPQTPKSGIDYGTQVITSKTDDISEQLTLQT